MLRYSTGEKEQKKWTQKELLGIAGFACLLFCIWALFEIKGCWADDNRQQLVRTRAQLADARKKNETLTAQLTEAQKQLQDATDRIFDLTSVAGRAPALPVKIKSWRDTSTTRSVALENEGEKDLSVHVSVTNPNRSRPREQDCFIAAHKTVGTTFRIYPRDVVIVTAEGFATKTQRME